MISPSHVAVGQPDLTEVAGLAEVAGRARPVSLAGEKVLPVLAPLLPLLPDGGLRRGSTVVIRPSAIGGSTSLALALLVEASKAGCWCAVVGLPSLGLVAAAGFQIELARLALVPDPGDQWTVVTASMLDAVDMVLVGSSRRIRPADARRLVGRARERGAVLVPAGDGWPEGADLRLSVMAAVWQGLGKGHGLLQARAVEVMSAGRGAASRQRRAQLWLPGPDGRVTSYSAPAGRRDELAAAG